MIQAKKQKSADLRRVDTDSQDLHRTAFDKSVQANIISLPGRNGKIIRTNQAACKLLGYSKKELLTKTRAAIFNIKESNFRKMLQQTKSSGHSIAIVTASKKNGEPLQCEITSEVFKDDGGVEITITSIVDMKQRLLEQKNIDSKKEKV